VIHYVSGLLFNPTHESVVLILKDHGPASLVGKWNAVGGKMTPGEHAPAAMHREFLEETGVSILPRAWTRFLTLRSNHFLPAGAPHPSHIAWRPSDEGDEPWTVDFFHATASDEALRRARKMETEEVMTWYLDALPVVVENLRWIIPMALHKQAFGGPVYDVTERGA
jgi:8-oxo-dGTP pyrophosphatase MutT (NUDIX family)